MNDDEVKELCRQVKERLARDLWHARYGIIKEDDMRRLVNNVRDEWLAKAEADD